MAITQVLKGSIQIDAIIKTAIDKKIIGEATIEVKSWLGEIFKQLRKLEKVDANYKAVIKGTLPSGLVETQRESKPAQEDLQKIADIFFSFLVVNAPQGVRDIDSLI